MVKSFVFVFVFVYFKKIKCRKIVTKNEIKQTTRTKNVVNNFFAKRQEISRPRNVGSVA